jgi:hypothetical protein
MADLFKLVELLDAVWFILLIIALLALRLQMIKVRRHEEEIRDTNLRILRTVGYLVKYCNAPIDVLLTDLKDMNAYLTDVPEDDILGQLLDKYIRS